MPNDAPSAGMRDDAPSAGMTVRTDSVIDVLSGPVRAFASEATVRLFFGS